MDHGLEMALRHQPERLLDMGLGRAPAAVHRDVLAEELDEVDLHLLAAVGADGREPGAGRERIDGTHQDRAAGHLQRRIDAAAIGEPPRRVADALARVVDRGVGAEGAGLLQLLLGARGGDHPRARELRDLHRGGADAAARRRDQHRLARAEADLLDQRLPRRRKGNLAGHRILIGKRVGDADHVVVVHLYVLGVAAPMGDAQHAGVHTQILAAVAAVAAGTAAQHEVRRDPVALVEPRHPGADVCDGARRVDPHDMRHGAVDAEETLAQVGIAMVHAGGMDLDEELAGTRRRRLHILVDERVERLAIAVNHRSLHRLPPATRTLARLSAGAAIAATAAAARWTLVCRRARRSRSSA